MANRKAHVKWGIASGAATAMVRSGDQDLWKKLAEAAGGGIGGSLGGRMPDILEPATSSWHRAEAHSVAAGAGMVTLAGKLLGDWEHACRTKADSFAAQRGQQNGGTAADILLAIAELLCRMAAGAASGFCAGYGSHLVLDAMTPRSIPLLSPSLL